MRNYLVFLMSSQLILAEIIESPWPNGCDESASYVYIYVVL